MKIKSAGNAFIAGLFLLGAIIIVANSISSLRTSQIQDIWLEFELDRNDRLRALIALRSELGYGGMIHQFKNYILRQKKSDSETVVSSIGGAKAELNRYKLLQLNAAEERAILQIENTLDKYQNALNLIHELIQQKKTEKQIDDIVKIDDFNTLGALKALEIETHILGNEQENIRTRPLILNSLRTAMGYGGVIHNFKNYILRHSPEAYTRVQAEADNIEVLVKMYRQYKLSPIEQNALKNILMVVQSYRQNLSVIQEMSNKGNSPRNIDKVVIINDRPALEGFQSLQRAIILNNEQRAKQLNEALRIVQISGKVIFYITLVSFLALILIAFWLLNCRILRPITKLTQSMSRLSNDDLNVNVFTTEQDTEICEMARSVNVFKKNAIKKRQAENALQILNEQLEEKVQARTQQLAANEARLAAIAGHAVEGEERLRNLINTAMDAVVLIDEEGNIINWNKQAEKIFGWSNQEVTGRALHELIIPEQYREMHMKGLQRFLTTGNPSILNARIEISALHRDAHEFPIELTVSPIKYKGRHQFSAFIRDITEQKESEQAITQAKEEAEAANQAKSEFLANMSHELRTPLHGILSFSNFGIKKSDTAPREKLHKFFTNIHISGERLLVLLNDLLDLSKLEAGKMVLNMKKGNLADVFDSCYREQEQRMEDLGLKLQLIRPDYPLTGFFDIPSIGQVITNLLSNAIKFSSEGGLITATIYKNDNQELCFSLQNEGVNIPEDELESIFDAFIQSSKTKTGAGGTGLGLAISRKIIAEHNGKIWVENKPMEGVLFKFIISVAQDQISNLPENV